ncbi:hypothetical protein Bca4012_065633 [Brassica carinata]|uniref:DUF4283 domain-containing protein n=1 Tax=Brassica carinata TaxID=52824 RepID=A0A8X7VNJ2_BRACI|nr:hypothetical protein Bca52824_017941 [Brassica carinata]
MSSALDKALLAMSLEEEEIPFDLPDLPQYSSCQNNSISLIGRILNPDCQKVSNLIRDMPRKWQKFDRVRGIALSPERFQFIFKYEHDLLEVYEKGVHSFNDWTLAIERWVERPPPDYLNFINIWVRLRNIPVNHYTAKAIEALGDLVGRVVVVAFDPSKPRINDYERVLVRFDVSRPLYKSRIVNLPGGEQTTISYEYERIHKRCYHCQRLTHEQMVCPFKLRDLQKSSEQSNILYKGLKTSQDKVLKESDPLFGVLEENQVGINPATGRPRIAKEVLDGMRQYLLTASGPEKIIRELRVKASLEDIGNDPMAQKAFLSLETLPLITSDIDKGKGPVFEYQKATPAEFPDSVPGYHTKLLESAIQAGRNKNEFPIPEFFYSEGSANSSYDNSRSYLEFSSVNSAIVGEAGTSRSVDVFKSGRARRRPPKSKRQSNEGALDANQISYKNTVVKRKSDQEVKQGSKIKRKLNEAVPMEGLPKDI